MSVLTQALSSTIAPGSDCRDAFRSAYSNRYTWEPGFGGYQGRCIWTQGDQRVEGTFLSLIHI